MALLMGSRNRVGDQPQGGPLMEIEDAPVILPPVNNNQLIDRFSKTLIGRFFCTEGRSIEAKLAVLPKPHIWDVEGRVRGFDLGNDRFQFDFESEDDLRRVLNKRPCHVNHWTFALERWEPNIRVDFPSRVTFWIQTKELPPEHWNDEALTRIGETLGIVVKTDEKSAKLQVAVDVTKPLKFEKKAISAEGEEISVSLKYEKLHRYCFTCKMISHEERSCPLLSEEERFQKKAERAALAREAKEEEEQSRYYVKDYKTTSRAGSNQDLKREAPHRSDLDDLVLSKDAKHGYRTVSRSRHSPLDYHQEDRNRNPVWQRLSEHRDQDRGAYHRSYLPRIRENFNYPSSEYPPRDHRKRRFEESATSSWRPRMLHQREDEHRGMKYQRTNTAKRSDMRYHLDKKRESNYAPREEVRHAKGSGNTVKLYIPRPRLSSQDRDRAVDEDVSKTVTDTALRHHRPSGVTHYYREKSPRAKVISPITKQTRPEGSPHSRNASPFTAFQEKSKEQLSIEKEAVALSNKKVVVSFPVDISLKEKPKEKGRKDALLSEEDLEQLQKEMAASKVTITENEELELLRKADEFMMEQEDVDNDDLFEDELQISKDQTVSDRIQPLSRRTRRQNSSSPSPNNTRDLPSYSRRPAKERIELPTLPISKSAHRKRKADLKKRSIKSSKELMGISSRKRNAVQLNGSPSKRPGTFSTSEKSKPKVQKSTLPHIGVFPSAFSKKSKSLSGLVGSQKPPSKDI